jgi:hypothetical protein
MASFLSPSGPGRLDPFAVFDDDDPPVRAPVRGPTWTVTAMSPNSLGQTLEMPSETTKGELYTMVLGNRDDPRWLYSQPTVPINGQCVAGMCRPPPSIAREALVLGRECARSHTDTHSHSHAVVCFTVASALQMPSAAVKAFNAAVAHREAGDLSTSALYWHHR